MSFSMYQASAPVFVLTLKNLATVLKKIEAHCEHKKIDPSVMLHARLYPDMFPLIRQVQIASDAAKACMARLAGQEPAKIDDTEKTVAELCARIEKTIAIVNAFKSADIDGSEDKTIQVPRRNGEPRVFLGRDFLLHYSLPNLFFHVTTAYAIARHNGVELGKNDFLGL